MNTDVQPVGPRPLPGIGNLHQFLPDRLRFLRECAAQYGPVVRLQIGRLTYLLNDAEDIRYVLERNPSNYDKTPRLTSRRGRRISGTGLLTSTAAESPTFRAFLQPLFHRRVVASLAGAVNDSTEMMTSRWRDGAQIDIAGEMMSLARQVVGRALFGVDFSGSHRALGDAIVVRRAYLHYVFGSPLPFPEWLPTRANLQYRRAVRDIDREIYGMIEERRRSSEPRGDFLDMLVRARDEHNEAMTDSHIRDEALMISVTGHETIGEALSWTAYLLSQHPDVEEKLRQELDTVLGDRPPTPDDLPHLRYTEMVLSESMRLYPPTWIFIRMARQADTLPGGTRIPANAKLFLCPWVTHRDAGYFPDPERFDPERFASGAPARPKFSYFPFGGGPRVCIGQAMAKMESALILAGVAQRWGFVLAPGQDLTPDPAITLRPKHGINVRLVAH